MALKISLVTPSFNQAAYIEQTIKSVLNQDYSNIEYLVIDGGSTDGSAEIIRQYSDRLDYWCSEPDGGQADALRKGFEKCTGDILCWLNSDDILLPGAISKVARFFDDNPEVENVSGGAFYIDQHNQAMSGFGAISLGVEASFDRFRFYQQDGVFQQAAFWRRSAYNAVGGIDPSLNFIMDYDLFTRLARLSSFRQLPEFLACFRLHAQCKSSRLEEVRRQEVEQYRIRFGVSELALWQKRLLYWRFRGPSLARKMQLRLRRKVGLLRIPQVNV